MVSRSTLGTAKFALLSAIVCLAIFAQNATANGTVAVSGAPGYGSTLVFSAGANEQDFLTVDANALVYTFEQASVGITAGNGCNQVSATKVTCAKPAVTQITVNLGDLLDTLGVGAGIPTTTRVIADGQADGANLSASTAVSSVTFTSVAGDIYGGAAPDSITAGPNYVNGAWDPEEGSDPPAYIDGGASQDVITVGLAASQRQESVNSFPLVVHGGPDSDFIDASSSQGDVYYGQGFGDDMFIGGSGNDGIGVGNGAHGADRLYGGPGNDLFVSYQGNDGGDRAYGGPGNDKFIGISPGGSVDFDGGAGVDTVAYEDEGVNVPHVSRIALDDLADDGPNGTDNIRSTVENISTQGVTNVGLSGDNVLVGNYLSNNIHGGGGNDTITGGGGTDVLFGEVGNDNIQATDGQVDTINCGSGTDTVDADAIDIINADCEPQFLTTH